MKRLLLRLACFILSALLMCPSAFSAQNPQQDTPWPQGQWRFSSPEAQGIDSERLAAMFDHIAQNNINIHSLQLVRHGHVVLDAYFYPFPANSLHDVASVTKSITSALVGIALDRRLLTGVNQTALSALPGARPARLDARKQAIALEHLLTMTPGLDCGYRRGEAELFEMLRTDDWVRYVLDRPMRDRPGSRFAYCSGGFHLLSAVLTGATRRSGLDFAREHLFAPLGITDVYWPSDRQGITHGWGDLHLRPLDMARIGYLYLRRGRWHGRQVISEEWVERSTRRQVARERGDDYGYGWWVSDSVPGLYEALGRGGQRISVWPQKDLVVVMTGGGFEPGSLAPFLLSALSSDRPLPENPEAYRRLQERVAAAARPPAPVRTQPLPATARDVSGRVYQLANNSLGVRSFRVRFFGEAEGEVTLYLSDRQIVVPIGLDGVYRIGADALTDLPLGGRAVWRSANELALDLNMIARINRYDISVRFTSNTIVLRVTEATGLTNETITGVAR